jgi:DNA-binding MarR family transcriptional regulator
MLVQERMNRQTMNESSQFGFWISVLNRAAYKYYRKVLKPYSVGPGEQAYLVSLQPEEVVTQATLAGRLYVDKANVARALRDLERAGYVQRKRSDDDRREVLVRLTPLGTRVRSEVEEKMRQWVEALRSQVPQDRWEEMASTIETIARYAEEYADSVDTSVR